MKKAVFLDRDGVINRRAPIDQYITTWEDMHILPGVAQAIGVLNETGYLVVVATNQRCVAKGLITASQLETLHKSMLGELARDGGIVDAVYYCPHELSPPCECRKPKPGMLLRAAREHEIDLAASWMIGDSARDIGAGKSAGCRTIRLLGGGETKDADADVVAPSLIEAARKIIESEHHVGSEMNRSPDH
jgi:histidinol-phosphate phosphatase family protein